MSVGKMHDDEVDIDVALVYRLLAAQFPQWASGQRAPLVAQTCPISATCHPRFFREGNTGRELSLALVSLPVARRRDRDHRAHHRFRPCGA